jgi:hypothetical protein
VGDAGGRARGGLSVRKASFPPRQAGVQRLWSPPPTGAPISPSLICPEQFGDAPPPSAPRSTPHPAPPMTHSEIVSFLWGTADLIRASFKRGKYQDVILPLAVLRRIDCVLKPTKEAVLETNAGYGDDEERLAKPGKVATVCDPCCGTGGMLTITKDFIQGSPEIEGVNPGTFAVSRSDLYLKSESGRGALRGASANVMSGAMSSTGCSFASG